jgi:proline dehydrogenase
MSIFHDAIVRTLPLVPKPIVYRFARRYVAGESLDDAVARIRELAAEGCSATIDVLGEDITRREEARGAVADYLAVLERIAADRLDANISIKPSMFGLKLDRDFCLENIREVVLSAKAKDVFVRLDMEDSTCTDETFRLTRELRKVHPKLGVVIQAYLRRTVADVDALVAEGTNVRLCKGIYVERREIAWKERDIVIRNYGLCCDKLLSGGCYVGIATHDEACVWEALRTIDRLKLPRDRYEFQMLLGVEERLRRILVAEGHRMRVYVPFGRSWHAYSMRRLKENPAIAGHIVKAFFARGE